MAEGAIVSAPGSAPGTFALEFLLRCYPDKEAQFAEMRAIFGANMLKPPDNMLSGDCGMMTKRTTISKVCEWPCR